MPLPPAWLDRLFAKLTVAYGAEFLRKWEGVPIEDVKAEWADVLDGFEKIKICTGYRLHGELIDYLPANAQDQAAVEPVYEEIEGWEGTTVGARSWADLPAQAIKYIRRIEELIECPVASVSTSPERDDTILVRDPFAG